MSAGYQLAWRVSFKVICCSLIAFASFNVCRKKRFVLPFTQQYFHLRNLKATGKVPKHGSFKYTAARLHEKGVLLSIDQFSDKQLDQISLTISSDEVGLFTIDASVLGVSGGSVDLRIEDLLEAQFNNQQTMTLMDGMVKVNINLLVHLINRSELVLSSLLRTTTRMTLAGWLADHVFVLRHLLTFAVPLSEFYA